MKLKVCGLKDPANIKAIAALDIDYIGFIFYDRSPRYFDEGLSFDEVRQIPKRIKKVGVFVNASTYGIMDKVAHYNLDLVQLHGNESPAQCMELKPYVQVIKAFPVKEDFDLKPLESFVNAVHYFLFDAAGKNFGGNGISFDFPLLKKYNYHIPYFLSGGIDEISLPEIQAAGIKPYALDINSRFEIRPGEKDVTAVDQFIKAKNICTTI